MTAEEGFAQLRSAGFTIRRIGATIDGVRTAYMQERDDPSSCLLIAHLADLDAEHRIEELSAFLKRYG